MERQRALSYVGRSGSWVFPNSRGGPISYHNWRQRGWTRALQRSGVQPREGDAQKALRRSFITAGLICGRNPKEVASEVGHASLRMLVSVYASFLDPSTWPDASEVARLRVLFGWPEATRVPEKSLSEASAR
jgi:integrase